MKSVSNRRAAMHSRATGAVLWGSLLVFLSLSHPLQADPAEETLGRARVTLDFTQAPLAGILQAMQAQSGVTLAMDAACAEALAAAGDRFTAKVKDAPAGTVLDALLDGSSLTWFSDGSRIDIVPRARAGTETVTRAYPVGDLLPALEATVPGTGEDRSAEALRALVALVRDAEPGAGWGGPEAALGADGEMLWVTHTRAVHAQVRSFLGALRGAIGHTVEFRAALIEVPLEGWRALAPAGTRALRAEEFEALLHEARNKSRVLREFAAAALEGTDARFETETQHPYVAGWRLERPGSSVEKVPQSGREISRIRITLRPGGLDGGGRVAVGVRCELRRAESSSWAQTPLGPIELPRAAERIAAGAVGVAPGGAFAWRLGREFGSDEGDRVLALIVRIVAAHAPAGGARRSVDEDPRLAGTGTNDAWPAGPALETAGEAARRAGLGVVHGPAPAGSTAAGDWPAGASAAAVVRAACARLGIEAWIRDGILCLGGAPAADRWSVARIPSLDEVAPFDSLGVAVPRAAARAEPENPFRPVSAATRAPGHAAPAWLRAHAAGALSVPGGRVLWRGARPGLAAALAEIAREGSEFVAVEADVIEVDALRASERGAAFPASGLALSPAAARELLDAADRRRGVERRLGLTGTSPVGRFGGGAEREDAAYLADDAAAAVRAATGLALRVRARRDGDGFRVDADGEWAAVLGSAVGPDGAASPGLPSLALAPVQGGARIAEDGALAFSLTHGLEPEQKSLLLVVRVSRPRNAPDAEKK